MVDSLASQRLADHPAVHLKIYDTLCQAGELLGRIRQAHTIIVMHPSTVLSRAVIKECQNLKHIALWGIATGNVDFEAASELGIVITHTPESYVESVSEHALALMLALARRIPELNDRIRAGEWPGGILTQLAGKTLGVIGIGIVGWRLLRICHGIGMKVLGTEVYASNDSKEYPSGAQAVQLVDLETLLRSADVVSLHAEQSYGEVPRFDRNVFSMMKSTAFFINTSTPQIVDEYALAEALRNGTIAGAALDVFNHEPVRHDNPLVELPNVILSPHIGLNTLEATSMGLNDLVESVIAYFEGRVISRANFPGRR